MSACSSYSTQSGLKPSSTLITPSGLNTAKNLINKTNCHLNHQFISPINTNHNRFPNKTMSEGMRCKPTPRLNRFVHEQNDPHRLERNYSYIEAMKECKTLESPYSFSSSSPSSTSSSSIESPLNPASGAQHDEVEIPIEIKLKHETLQPQSNLTKSKSQSSLLSLFKSTFSPFQIRKWRSKSRDKLVANTSLNPPPPTGPDTNPVRPKSSAKTNTSKSNYTNLYAKNTSLANKQSFNSSMMNKSRNEKPPLPIPLPQNGIKLNNSSYTSSISDESESSSSSAQAEFTKTNQTSSPVLMQASPSSNTSRQLSYLKLTCLLNGYDSKQVNMMDQSALDEQEKENLAILNTSERYYDVKLRNTIKNDSQMERCDVGARNSGLIKIVNLSSKRSNETSNLENENELISDLKAFKIDLNIKSSIKNCDDNDLKNFSNIIDKIEPLKMINDDDEMRANSVDVVQDEQTITQDGNYFIKLLDKSTVHINELCKQFQMYVDETHESYVTNEEALGQIQTTIGKGQLLINQKFKQFRGLCVKNIKDKIDPTPLKEGEFVTRDDDLAGFWDMVYLQVEEIDKMFSNLEDLKKNGWKMEPVIKPVVVKKKIPIKSASTSSSSASSESSKARADAARQRLLEAKKKAALLAKQKEKESTSFLTEQDTEIVVT